MSEKKRNIIEAEVRDVETVTTEIKMLVTEAQTLALNYAIEIGRRLVEVKQMVPHGDWGNYLKEKVNFSQSSANNFMKIFEEYGDSQLTFFGATAKSQTLGNLPYTKALKLIAVPADERESFVAENDIANISTRELDKIIKERDEAKNKAEQFEKIKKQLEKAKENEKKVKSQLEELKNNPKVPDDVIDKIKSEAQNEVLGKVENEIKKTEEEKQELEKKLTKASFEVEKLKKELMMTNSDVTEFKTIFSGVQDDIFKCKSLIAKISSSDKELGDKLKKAMNALFESVKE